MPVSKRIKVRAHCYEMQQLVMQKQERGCLQRLLTRQSCEADVQAGFRCCDDLSRAGGYSHRYIDGVRFGAIESPSEAGQSECGTPVMQRHGASSWPRGEV
jgi:hypothetical protein